MSRREIGPDLVATATHLLADLEAIANEIATSCETVVTRAFPDSDPGLRPRAIIGAKAGLGSSPDGDAIDEALRAERQRLLEAGARAVAKVAADREDVNLTAEEQAGLETVVRFTARPAILLHEGQFGDPPPPWGPSLAPRRDDIAFVAERVGRIELAGLPHIPYAGTGFLVAPDVVMTNQHVAMLFSHLGPDRRWAFQPGLGASVDFVDDPDTDEPRELRVEEVIGIHERLDLALLRLAGPGEVSDPLTVMSEDPDEVEGRSIYVIGYPAPDPRNDPVMQRAIFGDRYYAKRLQPGALLAHPADAQIRQSPFSEGARDGDVVFHDASTLGGNSGSCVVDLDSRLVVGLHFGGSYLKHNQAVALWKLRGDPLLADAGVNFD